MSVFHGQTVLDDAGVPGGSQGCSRDRRCPSGPDFQTRDLHGHLESCNVAVPSTVDVLSHCS